MAGRPRLAPALLVLAAILQLGAKDPSAPGAYCPLPKEGELPSCLADAQETYRGFYLGLQAGELDEAETERVESDLKGATPENRFEALSTLSYGYFTLALQLSRSDAPNPLLRARLERWNELLGEAYADNPADRRYRAAVREAAVDLERNVPALGLRCTDEEGRVTECRSTEAVIRAMDARHQETGLRGALSRLLQALLPDDSP